MKHSIVGGWEDGMIHWRILETARPAGLDSQTKAQHIEVQDDDYVKMILIESREFFKNSMENQVRRAQRRELERRNGRSCFAKLQEDKESNPEMNRKAGTLL
eukprot:scaffold2513_cov77-Cylindrotheca_fusiformis.AAC.1